MRAARATAAKPTSKMFRANRKWVRYAGHRWLLICEHERFVYLERGNGRYGQWVAKACVR